MEFTLSYSQTELHLPRNISYSHIMETSPAAKEHGFLLLDSQHYYPQNQKQNFNEIFSNKRLLDIIINMSFMYALFC